MTAVHTAEYSAQADDGHRWMLQACIPDAPVASLLWLPAMGIAARHYLPFAQALAGQGIAAFVHEWRGNGSSNLRAARAHDWGYRELLTLDLPASESAVQSAVGAMRSDPLRIVGGHSLGGQLAACRLALAPASARMLWLIASGSPYWRAFPLPQRFWLPLAYGFLPLLAHLCGALPGRLVRFAGNEARGLIDDWSRSAISGRYAAAGLDIDLESRLATVDAPLRAAVFAEDWLAPPSSLQCLLSKFSKAPSQTRLFDAASLSARADHFAWMKSPGSVATWLASNVSAP